MIAPMKPIQLAALLSCLWLATPAGAAEPCETLRPAEARSAPDGAAPVVARLPTAATLQCWRRQGPWQQVMTADGRLAWLWRYQVRSAPAREAPGGLRARLAGLARTLTGLFDGLGSRQSPNRPAVTATIGIRSLNPGQSLDARPDPAQLARLQRQAVDAAQARRFAAAGGLQSRLGVVR